ncbi:unnamed protein product [Brachionus calyciflorus]|uniref:Reverse transcriptase domain-containing protein n=1 Tax=Brachionus calyciflorus TaxID=104777 RepID=A0A814PDA6_9BILA|nr:unnamed protein product [Brachionus calyciflorus]
MKSAIKCRIIGHKIAACKAEEYTCLMCGESGHEKCSKNSRDNIKCILCKRKHYSFCRSCEIIKSKTRKCNRNYAKILKNHRIKCETIDKLYKDETVENIPETRNEIIDTMMEAIAARVDTLTKEIKNQQEDISTIAEVILAHDDRIGANEKKNLEVDIRITGFSNYIADEFSSIKEFWKDAIKNKEFRPTKSIEEHNEKARNKIQELKTQNISHGSLTVNNPFEHSIDQQKSTDKPGNNESQNQDNLIDLNLTNIKIASLNCNGLRNNIIYVKYVECENEILFLQEMWCNERSDILGRDLNFNIHFKSSESNSSISRKGKSGGIGWIINKKIGKHEVIFLSDIISFFKQNKVAIIGVYLTLSDNTIENRMIKEYEFQLNSNKLECQDIRQVKDTSFTYFKHSKSSWIDHIVTFKKDDYLVKNIKVISSKWNCGDHFALAGSLNLESNLLNQKENEIKTKQRIVWNDRTKKIYFDKLECLINEISDTLPEIYFKDMKLLCNGLDSVINKLNQAMTDALNEITEENLRLFYRKIHDVREEKNEINVDLNQARDEIFKLFNECDVSNSDIEKEHCNKVDEFIRINSDKVFNIKIDENRITNLINKLENNKSPGYNKITNEMIKFGSSQKFIKILQLIYETIINYNIIPKSFNIGLVKLLIKDPKKSNSDMKNMRPLTISDCWAIILEKYLLDEINKNLKNTKSNQFGFKAKSSCGHAVFTLNESTPVKLLIKYIELSYGRKLFLSSQFGYVEY